MATEAQICSNALRMLGANPITSLSDDTTEGRLCSGLYAPSRDALIAEHPWNFCKKRISLAQLTSTPAFDYTVEYQLPADYISVISVWPDTEPYKIEGRKVLSYATGLKMRYKAQVTDTSEFPSYFVNTLEYYMAARLSYPLLRSRTMTRESYDLYYQMLAQAKIRNDHEDTQDSIVTDDLITVRISN